MIGGMSIQAKERTAILLGVCEMLENQMIPPDPEGADAIRDLIKAHQSLQAAVFDLAQASTFSRDALSRI